LHGQKPQKPLEPPQTVEAELPAMVKTAALHVDTLIRAHAAGVVNFQFTQAVLDRLLLIKNSARSKTARTSK